MQDKGNLKPLCQYTHENVATEKYTVLTLQYSGGSLLLLCGCDLAIGLYLHISQVDDVE